MYLSIKPSFFVYMQRLDEKPGTEEEQEAYNELKLKHLSPIVINFNLPLKYPSSCIPDYSLSCKWLGVKEVSLFS